MGSQTAKESLKLGVSYYNFRLNGKNFFTINWNSGKEQNFREFLKSACKRKLIIEPFPMLLWESQYNGNLIPKIIVEKKNA